MSDERVVQEPDRLERQPTYVVTAGVVVVTVLAIAAAGVLLRALIPEPVDPQRRAAAREIGGIEQTLIMRDGEGVRRTAEQRQQLESFGWVDRDKGVVRIPIERAFELVVETERR